MATNEQKYAILREVLSGKSKVIVLRRSGWEGDITVYEHYRTIEPCKEGAFTRAAQLIRNLEAV